MALEAKPILQRITVSRPAPAVFRALTDPDEVAAWFAEDAYIELVDGGRYEILGRRGWKKGRIEKLEDDRRLTISWPIEFEEREASTTIDFTLESRGDKTLVTVSHTGLETGGDWDEVYQELESGWPAALETLEKFIQGGYKGKPKTWLP